jgi:hypothetical protein
VALDGTTKIHRSREISDTRAGVRSSSAALTRWPPTGIGTGVTAPPDETATSSASPSPAPGSGRDGAWAAGARAIRRYARPFISIQLAAVGLVVAYALSADFRAACATLAALREDSGLAFSAVAGAAAGGVLPELLKWLLAPGANRLRGRGHEVAVNTAFLVAFFAFNGVVIDLFYRQMARLFGSAATVVTVVEKVAFDQFIFTPCWLAIIIALFAWQAAGFRVRATGQALRGNFYRRRVVPLLLPNWAFWIPMTAVIYALPGPLQFLLFALALAAWSLIMVFIAQS